MSELRTPSILYIHVHVGVVAFLCLVYAETSAYSATQLLTQPTKAVAFSSCRSTTFVCAEKKRQNRLDFRQQKKELAVSARRNPWSVAVAYV